MSSVWIGNAAVFGERESVGFIVHHRSGIEVLKRTTALPAVESRRMRSELKLKSGEIVIVLESIAQRTVLFQLSQNCSSGGTFGLAAFASSIFLVLFRLIQTCL